MLGIKAQVQENGPIERNNEQALWHHVAWGNRSVMLKLLVAKKIYDQRQVRDLKKNERIIFTV